MYKNLPKEKAISCTQHVHSMLRLDATTKKKGSIENSSNSKNLASNKQFLL